MSNPTPAAADKVDRLARHALFGFVVTFILPRTVVFLITRCPANRRFQLRHVQRG
jgi:hypothetical protein